MRITKREILFSTIIICIMIGFGLLISKPIVNSLTEKALDTISSTQVCDSSKFDYIRRTDVGRFLAEGKLITVDPVSITDIKGEYSKIVKEKEEYRQHMRVVTTVDSKGHSHSHTEIYWTWDVVDKWKWESKTVKFLGQNFIPKEIGYNFRVHHQETIEAERHFLENKTRYKYYTCPTITEGVLRGTAEDKKFIKLSFVDNTTINQIIDSANNDITMTPIVFWILWILLTAGIIWLFFYLENDWLEDKQKQI